MLKFALNLQLPCYFKSNFSFVPFLCLNQLHVFSVCLQGGRVTLASVLTLAEGQKIARVYQQNFTGRVKPYNQGKLNVRLHSKSLETKIKKLTWVGK